MARHLALLWMLVLLAPAASAQELLPSIKQIVDRGTLRIAVVNAPRPPMLEHGKDGGLQGFDVDLGKEIAQAMDVEVEFVPTGPRDEDVVAAIAAGKADIGLSYLTESVAMARRVYFSRPYMIESVTVFLNRAKSLELEGECPSIGALRRMMRAGDGVGVVQSSPYAALLARATNGPTPRSFEDLKSLADAVGSGEIAASVQGELPAKNHLTSHPEAAIHLRFCDVPGRKHRVAAVVRPDAIDLLRWLDIYIAQRGVIIDLDALIYREARGIY